MIPRFANPSDAAELTRICSHPEVRAWTAYDGAPEFEPMRWLRKPQLAVLVPHGVFLANSLGGTSYEVHTNILPEGRGAQALESAAVALSLGFLGSDAETFQTKVPENNRRATWFTRAMGFRATFVREKVWLHRGLMRDVCYYTMGIDDWVLRGTFLGLGQAFHEEVHALGIPSHEEDFAHDCYVGAAVALVAAGKPHKAMKIYNRWARFAGYEPLVLVSSDPLVIDARDFLIHKTGEGMKLELKEKQHA